MLSKIMKWVSGSVLLLTTIFWGLATEYELLLKVVVFMGAIVVLEQAIKERQYVWTIGFATIALIFNPAAPLFQASASGFRLLAFAGAAMFAASLALLKSHPILSMASITDRTPRSESL